MKAAIDFLYVEFCREAAIFEETRGYEGSGADSAVDWLSEHCHMAEEDAEVSIEIGQMVIRARGAVV